MILPEIMILINMFNYDITSQIPDQPYTIIMIGGSGSGKTNALFNLTKQHDDDIIVPLIKLLVC